MNAIFALATVVIKELYRRKDFYVLFVLTVVITLILGFGNLFDNDKIAGYLKEICMRLIWISALVMAVAMSARQIPAEQENRTIFPLLAKPVTRAHLIAGKFLGCWLACGLVLIVFYLFLGIVTGAREHAWPMLHYAQALWMHWMFLAVVITMVMLGSILLSAPASNAVLCIILVLGILLIGPHLGNFAIQRHEPESSLLYALHFLVPRLEFFDLQDLIVRNAGKVQWKYIAQASLYAVSYAGFFLLATWAFFRRKALNT